jgi:hypothetical protein
MILRMRNYEEDVTMSAIYNDSAHAQLRKRCHTMSAIYNDPAHAQLRKRCHTMSDIFIMILRMRNHEEDVTV